MFYCDRCAVRASWPKSLFRSWRACELCHHAAPCSNTPASQLPDLSVDSLLMIIEERNEEEVRPIEKFKIKDFVSFWGWSVFYFFFPDWPENWKMWPHCNGQRGCWMHHAMRAWCRCRCGWCRTARILDRPLKRDHMRRRHER